MNNNKFNFLLPLGLAACLIVGLLFGKFLGSPTGMSFGGFSKGEERFEKMQDIIEILDNKYVDDVNGEKIFEKAIGDMLHQLDPHSNYIPASELKAMNESIQGKFGGIGVRFFVIRDTICVTNVIKDSPSDFAGIKAGDKIIRIEKQSVAGKKISNDKIMSMLKGDVDTEVNVEILRGKKHLPKRIVRGEIPIASVDCETMLNKTTGYVRIEQFSVTTSREFELAVVRLKQKGMKGLIIDLRNNGGGVLQSATDIADQILPSGCVIVKTKGKHVGEQVYRSTGGGLLEKTKICVLINENSASASEILAGAIQDNDRGTIIGRRSFGKGLVQEDIQLKDGSDLRLTIARYYTPTGRCIQKPYSGDYEDYYSDQMERMDHGELYKPDSSIFVDSLKFKTPKGKVVYGGGGIMPDVFIPYDSTGTSFYLTELLYSGAFQGFAFDFVADKRTKWSSPDEYNTTFQVNEELAKAFTKYAQKYFKVGFVAAEYKHSKSLIMKHIKQEIARQLWIEIGHFKVAVEKDKEVQKALRLLSN